MFSKLVAQNSVEDFVFGKTSWEKGSHSSTSTVDIMSLSQLLLWIFWLQLVISIGAIYWTAAWCSPAFINFTSAFSMWDLRQCPNSAIFRMAKFHGFGPLRWRKKNSKPWQRIGRKPAVTLGWNFGEYAFCWIPRQKINSESLSLWICQKGW